MRKYYNKALSFAFVACLCGQMSAQNQIENDGVEREHSKLLKEEMINIGKHSIPISSALKTIKSKLELNVDHSFEVVHKNNSVKNSKRNHTHYQQYYKGIEVEGRIISVHSNNEIVQSITGDFEAIGEINEIPSIDIDVALNSATEYLEKQYEREQSYHFDMRESKIVIIQNYNNEIENDFDLAYKLNLIDKENTVYSSIYVNAHNREIMYEMSHIDFIEHIGTGDTYFYGNKSIEVQSFQNANSTNAYRLHDDGIAVYHQYIGNEVIGDNEHFLASDIDYNEEAITAFWSAKICRDYFSSIGIQTTRRIVVNSNHTGVGTYTIGEEIFFRDYSNLYEESIDIMGHEYMHTIFKNRRLGGHFGIEAKALEEGVCDIFGVSAEEFGAPEKDYWRIGEERNGLGQSNPYRSLIDPHEEGHPKVYQGQHWDENSSNYHVKSTVLSHWFYLLCTGVTGDNGFAPIEKDKALRVILNVIDHYWTGEFTYQKFSVCSKLAAEEEFGRNCDDYIAVVNAWHHVGLGDPFDEMVALGDHYHLTSALLTGSEEGYNASEYIFAENTVESGAVLKMDSRKQIQFNRGFQAINGSRVDASIYNCNELRVRGLDGLQSDETTEEEIINDDAIFTTINLYPNPTAGDFTLELPFETESMVYVMDLVGKLVIQEQMIGQQQLSLNDHPAGMYMVRVQNGEDVQTIKLLKE